MTTDPAALATPAVAPPQPDEDSRFYWDGLTARRLLVQRCARCGRHRFPPMPACPDCGFPGGEIGEVEARGTVYSWIVVHHAFAPAFRDEVPYAIAVVELGEGFRVVARLDTHEPIQAGQAVTGTYVDHGSWTELRFRATV